MNKPIFQKGQEVKIKLDKLELQVNKEVFKNISKFDKKHKGIHKITNIYSNMLTTDLYLHRYELDNEYVLYEAELI